MQPENVTGQPANLGLDSITLGQLRSMVSSAPKPKVFAEHATRTNLIHTAKQQATYDFRYDDEDTVLNEIDEFYSYVEMPQVAENLKAWEGSFSGGTPILFHPPAEHVPSSY
jgi:hypothetical protein